MAAGEAEPELAGVGDDAGGDVEEREAEPFAAAAAELAGQGEVSSQRAVLWARRAGVPPQPVPEEVLQWGVVEPEVLFQLADGVFGDPAAEPVVGFDHVGRAEPRGDVGDDGVEAPAVKIVQATTGPRRGWVGGARSDATSAASKSSRLPSLDHGLGDLVSRVAASAFSAGVHTVAGSAAKATHGGAHVGRCSAPTR